MKMKKWVTAAPDLEAARSLSEACGFSPLAAVALCARGVDTPEKAQAFLATGAEGLHDPMRLRDMDKAVAAIREAIREKQKIIVFGDYDVDGITSTCVLLRYLRSLGADADYYIPNRLSEGYGLSCAAMDALYEQGVRLIVTVDSGVTAFEETAYAKKLGIRMVITDHHECREELPEAEAIVNPRRSDCDYPFTELAGVGVAFKLICALAGPDNLGQVLDKYADLVALGTVADVMPIVGENRVIVAEGLRRLATTENLGLEMLLRESGQKSRRLTSSVISFILAPRINAAGRMGNTEQAVELFLTDDPVRAQELAAQLCEQNKERQAAENEILQQALAALRKEYNPLEDKMIVLAGEDWHHGVIGIVASRICDRYACPTVLIAVDGDIGKGSGRSMAGFNLFEALSDSADLLDKFGGHELAAGLTIQKSNIDEFKTRMLSYADTYI
ncbi:MAG: single-stranded-DNA-specific exonuclease RecJ, partial [Butyricicoccus sp.]